eukprot:3719510-Heterocapsa_arctica.AAC.1
MLTSCAVQAAQLQEAEQAEDGRTAKLAGGRRPRSSAALGVKHGCNKHACAPPRPFRPKARSV